MHPSPRRILSVSIATIFIALSMSVSAPAGSLVASSLLNEDDSYPDGGVDHVVVSINNTAVNHANGYAATVNSEGINGTLSHVWGNASGGAGANIRTEGTFGPLVQTSFESFYGMDDAGSVAYSASGTGGPVDGFDSAWKDDTPLAVEGDPYPHLGGQWWRFASRPGISADGVPFWVGGLTSTQGGNTENRGLFFGTPGVALPLGGDAVPDLPALLSTANTVSFDYRFSELATDYIAEVQMEGTSTSDNAMVVSGAGLILGGTLVREGNVIPVSVGGVGGEAWDNFDFTGITEAGDFFFTGDTDGDAATDEFILKNGVMMVREGDIVDGEMISGSLEGAYMNRDGDIAYIWDVDGGALEALFLNDRLLLKEGEAVDFDGNGVVDPGAVVSSFTGIASLTLSDRDLGNVKVYFTADVDTAGTSSTTDDVEGFYCMEVLGEPTAIALSNFRALTNLRSPGVHLEWETSLEIDHDGFHVYRSRARHGDYMRLTDELVRGRSPYTYLDKRVLPGTTYFYQIGAVDLSGIEQRYGPVEVTTPAWGRRTALAAARPNPFRLRTDIAFTLGREGHAKVSVYDVAGRVVTTLVDQELPAGEHTVSWDGTSRRGRVAAGGVYFYRLDSESFSQTRKLVHLQRQ
jgi:hypothetical protein